MHTPIRADRQGILLGVFTMGQFALAGFALAQFAVAHSLVAQFGLYVHEGHAQVMRSLSQLVGSK